MGNSRLLVGRLLMINFHTLGEFVPITSLSSRMGIVNLVMKFLNYILYELNICTNNYVESFYSMLRSTTGRHLPVWTFYDINMLTLHYSVSIVRRLIALC
ncbi:RING-type domain-containing protein [Aphis craccivora]|uniref:RING-type domain-containing protein n=1 Tax=Aphis craccivora TaxID=307492 RepID=A0A6G0Z013_APHCR|nr:RING-type domain-containing protein [Aphis craccivora]